MLIDGRAIAQTIYDDVSRRVAKLSFQPVFCDVLVGADPASIQYVNLKAKKTESVGMRFLRAELPATIPERELLSRIHELCATADLCGLIVQLPLPVSLHTPTVLEAVDPAVDVDGLHSITVNNFYQGNSKLVPPTAAAVIAVLESVLPLDAKPLCVVVGRGPLVGRPVAHLLQRRGWEVQVISKDTVAPAALARTADVLISGVGKPGLITADWIKPGAIVIDAGTAEDAGSIVGDVDRNSVEGVAAYLSPTPGGVGPVTVAKLLENVVSVAEGRN